MASTSAPGVVSGAPDPSADGPAGDGGGTHHDEVLSTRDQIVGAAISCFAAHGYEGTSLNEIAGIVGIRRPSLLHHFPSKEALYQEVFERLLSDWFDRLAVAIEADEVGWDKVELVLDAGFGFFADNLDYVRLVRREAIDASTHLAIDLGGVLRPMFDLAADYFEREMANGVFRPHDSRQLLVTGYGALLSYFSDEAFLHELLDDDPLSERALRARRDHVIELFRAALVP